MYILICGSRTLTGTDYWKVEQCLDELVKPEQSIVHGGAEGADMLTELWCRRHQRQTTVIRPDYATNPPHVAPLLRNQLMVNMAGATIAFIKGRMTNGTMDAIKRTRAANKPVMIIDLHDMSRTRQTTLPL